MFNLGRFNLSRFNVRTVGEVDVLVSLHSFAIVNAMVATGGNTYETLFASAMVQHGSELSAATMAPMAYGFVVSASAIPSKNDHAQLRAEAQMHMYAWMSDTLMPPLHADALVNGYAWMSRDVYELGLAAVSQVRQAAFLAHNMHEGLLLVVARVHAQVTTDRFAITEILVTANIPPGGTLIIDSENYNVLLNGENVIDTHSGEWLWLDRNVYDVVVGPMTGVGYSNKTILYTERWL